MILSGWLPGYVCLSILSLMFDFQMPADLDSAVILNVAICF